MHHLFPGFHCQRTYPTKIFCEFEGDYGGRPVAEKLEQLSSPIYDARMVTHIPFSINIQIGGRSVKKNIVLFGRVGYNLSFGLFCLLDRFKAPDSQYHH